MDEHLHHLVSARVDADDALPAEVGLLVLAACEGEDALAAELDGGATERSEPGSVPAPVDPPAAYITSIAVEGFRGVGPKAELSLNPGPGLTLVVGRNGSGKSSFAEGLEICLTGANLRWGKDRSKVWEDGWRNVHHGDPCAVSATFAVDGVPGAVTVTRSWAPDAPLELSTVSVTGHPTATSIDDLGWRGPLNSLRPFLSYNELGDMFTGPPSAVYDALAGILGLEDLVGVAGALKNQRTARDKALRAVKDRVPELLTLLDGIDDERAMSSRVALLGKDWNLEAIEFALDGLVEGGDPEGELATLRDLARVRRPDPEIAPEALREAARAADDLAATDAGAAHRVAELLKRALDHHHLVGDGPCPVCSVGALDPAWREQAETERAELEERAAAAEKAQAAVRTALAAAGRSLDPAPGCLHDGKQLGIDTADALKEWEAWHAGSVVSDPRALADHLEHRGPALDAVLATVREAATVELESRENAWRPAARALHDWIADARPAVAGARHSAALKAAENWVNGITGEVRAARFAPIANAAADHWATLRRGSSVDITNIGLGGTNTRRRVDIDVEIDGVGSAALGVMSQGELCSLALCMFLPRATLDESPFRFVVIDDPVQSMDPAKVDGLARVLETVATTRQVVVLTHDDRLPESVRRLGIEADVVEVTRGESSMVTLTPGLDPVETRLDDAAAAARARDLPEAIARRVVPGLCRQAIEAACISAVRRRRLSRGERHADVEKSLAGVTTLYGWVAMALFDDDSRESTSKVLGRLNNDRTLGARSADAFRNCNEGAHSGYAGPLKDLVRDAGHLARTLAGRK
ncbi:MAG: AAA family ATPase [Thermoleophilia bacterium]